MTTAPSEATFRSGRAQDYSSFLPPPTGLSSTLLTSIDRAGQDDARGPRHHASLACGMRRKPDWRSGTPPDPGNRPRQGVAGQRRAKVQPRRGRKSELARPIRPPVVTFGGLDVVDDFPPVIPVAQRELEVIETYLSALLDDALGRTE